MENKTTLQRVFENVKMSCTEKVKVELGVSYKCILRYEGRQLTVWHTVPTHYERQTQTPNKLDVIYGAWEDFATSQICKAVLDYAKKNNTRDIGIATSNFKKMQQRSKGFQRLFGERVINIFLNREEML